MIIIKFIVIIFLDQYDREFYNTPSFFETDWLNCFALRKEDSKPCDDFRFVYLGPQGSFTPLHCDVVGSFSWSTNICGRKFWRFFLPGEERYLKDKNGRLAMNLFTNPLDSTQCPDLHKANFVDIIQETGETVFVPSGWFHVVINLEDSLSINHNWINGANFAHFLGVLNEDLLQAAKEISDVKQDMESQEWFDQCQLLLKVREKTHFQTTCKCLVVHLIPEILH
eukprot:m.58195 g.58195  ORF g.58195 m.58195 type:complete len:225 (+) comp18976_c0_seq1:187-861(+)